MSMYPKEVLDLWFDGDEDEINKYGNYMVEKEDYLKESIHGDPLDDLSYYDEKINKLRGRECTSINDIIIRLDELSRVRKDEAKNIKRSKKLKKKDLGIASFLNDKKYKKKFMNKSKYRKELKKIAKNEKRELKDMRKLGYIKSKSIDEELNKIRKANQKISEALDDAYVQKHFL